jgi:hypothetical protein
MMFLGEIQGNAGPWKCQPENELQLAKWGFGVVKRGVDYEVEGRA